MSEFELPKVDLSGLDLTCLHDKTWAVARANIAIALKKFGGFEVVYDQVGPELRGGLLGQAIPELFEVPDVEKLINPSQELLQMIHKMVLEILGLEDHYNSHMESTDYSMRFTKYYNDLSEIGTKVVMPAHKDPNYISIIGQHDIGGLEIETSNGEWISTTPIKNSFTVLLGEAFMAWTNKRFQAPCHRVKMDGSEERYSIVFSTIPSFANDVINPPKELIDEEHPLLFKSFKYYDYVNFRFSDEGEKHKDTLQFYCGA
ncbi:probable 2-oxoglutarate-dependent dioxygenase AOP1.2 [Dendrobium catenatum]|uniref:probable 2-oxoglutarate-dependent dioxygenase AOP1.2 n=1 Tax=Dendrobium catenatum TaxID=906689 RepID=UPI00109F060F|nr:probable 2-oxoglutarate-dependent dioxygenase AOP1.2 [Dendrobium catenatum]